MFTGLVEDIGTIESAERRGDAVVLRVAPSSLDAGQLALGDSVAIDGVCLTVTAIDAASFEVLAGEETLRCTTAGRFAAGRRVNLERALRLGDRLGGHMVQGHVDGTAAMSSRVDHGANLEISFRPPPELLRYVVEKGSICIDGISLTVNRVDADSLSVALIPHTVSRTSLADKGVGDEVNIEVDMIAKYVERLTQGYRA